jgi:hypothetical protein
VGQQARREARGSARAEWRTSFLGSGFAEATFPSTGALQFIKNVCIFVGLLYPFAAPSGRILSKWMTAKGSH